MPQPAAHWRQVLAYQASSPPSDSSGGRANGSSRTRRAAEPNPVTPVAPTATLRNSRRERGWVMRGSLVARQAVRQAGHFLLGLIEMAFQTPTHIHPVHGPGSVHFRHVAVAGLAIQARPEVWLMAEVHKVGLNIDAPPGNGFASFRIPGEFLN